MSKNLHLVISLAFVPTVAFGMHSSQIARAAKIGIFNPTARLNPMGASTGSNVATPVVEANPEALKEVVNPIAEPHVLTSIVEDATAPVATPVTPVETAENQAPVNRVTTRVVGQPKHGQPLGVDEVPGKGEETFLTAEEVAQNEKQSASFIATIKQYVANAKNVDLKIAEKLTTQLESASVSMAAARTRLFGKTPEVATAEVKTEEAATVEKPATETVKPVDATVEVTVEPAKEEAANVQESYFAKGRTFVSSHKKAAMAFGAAGVVGAAAVAYNYLTGNKEVAAVVPPVKKPRFAMPKIAMPAFKLPKVAMPKIVMPELTRKNIAIAAVTTAAVVAATYALVSMYSKPSLEALAQKYIYNSTEQNDAVKFEQFCQAVEKYGYTSVADKQKALDLCVEAGLVHPQA